MLKHLIFIVGVIGCGGGGGVSVEDLPDELEGAQCDRAVACEGIADRATCDAAVDLNDAEFGALQAAVKDGTIKYDSGKADACADSLGDTDCTFPGFHTNNPCEGIFTGTVATGGACVIDLQCANLGNCVTMPSCDPETTCCTGTCMGMSAESPIGGPCANEVNFCAFDAFCKTPATGGAGTCTALIAGEGTACDEIDACANPLYCNLNFQTGAGTCKTPAASNATCSRMDLIPCTDTRDFCDPTMLKCVRDVAVGAACPAGVQCVGFASCIAGTCVADIAAGGACSVDTGADCAGNLECLGGTCKLPPVGMTCMLPPSS